MGTVKRQLELARLEVRNLGVGEDKALATAEIQPQVGTLLGGVRQNLIKRRKAVAIEPNGVVAAEVDDQITAVATGKEEGISPASPD